MICRISIILKRSVKMFVTLVFFLIAACAVEGHPLEASKQQYYSKYFLNSRIVGGEDAPEGYGKHMAALVFGYRWVSLICGGSIITKRHILTAAHCIDMFVTWNQQLTGSFRGIIGTKQWLNGTNEVQFIAHVLHPGWDWYTLKYDIGLLTVAADIQTSDKVSIMPLRFDWVDGGVNSYVTGWGQLGSKFEPEPKILQLLYVSTLSHKDCKERMTAASELLGPIPPLQEDIEICTLHSPGHGMCNGDSGSGLVMKETEEQIGIVSWGFPCAHGYPDVFVRISKFEGWLRSNTQGYLS